MVVACADGCDPRTIALTWNAKNWKRLRRRTRGRDRPVSGPVTPGTLAGLSRRLRDARDISPACRETPVRDVLNQNTCDFSGYLHVTQLAMSSDHRLVDGDLGSRMSSAYWLAPARACCGPALPVTRGSLEWSWHPQRLEAGQPAGWSRPIGSSSASLRTCRATRPPTSFRQRTCTGDNGSRMERRTARTWPGAATSTVA